MSAKSSPDSSPGQPVAQTFKVLVLGDSGVGKTSLINYYKDGFASPNLISTIGIDYSDITISVRGVRVKLRVWDTAGQERFHTFTKQFFRGAQGVILVYDITVLNSFTMLTKWMTMLSESGLSGLDSVIVGNKSDLKDNRSVPTELPELLSKEKSCPHLLTSTITGSNVRKAFYKMAESLVHTYNIFIPGLEAAAVYDGTDDLLHSRSSSQNGLGHSRDIRSDSIILTKEILKEDNSKKNQKCCK